MRLIFSNSTLTINGVNNQGINLTFAGPVSLTGSNVLNISQPGANTPGLISLTGAFGGVGALSVNTGVNIGSSLELSGTNTFTGGLTIAAGNLILGSAGALSTGPVTFSSPAAQAPRPDRHRHRARLR